MPGSVPTGWQRVRLGEIADVGTGGTPARERAEYWRGDVPWMASGEIHQRRVCATAECITSLGLKNSNAKVYPAETVMVAMNGQGRTRGTTALLGIEAACNQSLAAIRSDGRAEQRFLFHVLDQSYERLRNLTGDGRSGLNLELIRSFDLLLPPLPEQRAIAAVLDAIDDTIERTEAVIAATEELRRALLHELLTRGVPGMHLEWKHVPGLGTVPACWEVTTLGECLDRIEAGRSPLAESRPARPDEWGVLKVSSVSWGEFQPDENKALAPATLPDHRFEVQPGDVILSRANTPDLVGRAVLVGTTRPKLLLSDKTLRLIPDSGRIVREFLLLAISTPSSRAQISGSASGSSRSMFNVSQEALRGVQIALPSLTEQAHVAELITFASNRSNSSRGEADALRSVKAALADRLLSGRFRAHTRTEVPT
ncbi:MAG: restriction endonuclease subunit S [Dehalococcoidia bacterium]